MLQSASRSLRTISAARKLSTNATQPSSGCVFVDSVFPIQLGRFDLRRYIGEIQQDDLLHALKTRLARVKAHNFTITSLSPHPKDGGVFVRFDYNSSDDGNALQTIETELKQTLSADAPPSWLGLGTHAGQVWLVKGQPWTEDMNRYASPNLKVSFEGPDVHEESLYELLRPYGRIVQLSDPTPGPPGLPRYSTVTFRKLRSATVARNVLHGLKFSPGSNATTRLRTNYEAPIEVHAIRDWISKHPRIFLPVILTFLGTLTYTIFDPIRSLMIQGKVEEWFDYRENKIFQWLMTNTYDRLYSHPSPGFSESDVWKEREEAEEAVRTYLRDLPTTIAFIHGPQGSGKSTMLKGVLKNINRKTLEVDCRPLLKANSDTQLLTTLAGQTGYWPVFSFLNSLNHLIDLASMGLIGQKAGFSTSVSEQLKDILDVTTDALKNVSASHRTHIHQQMEREIKQKSRKLETIRRQEGIKNGTWHDGRLDCVAGNGVMSELGIGDELFGDADEVEAVNPFSDKNKEKQNDAVDTEAVESLPIVLIRNYESKGGASKDELMAVLATWAATLAENQIAHVIVVSDNRENVKRLTKALPTKPLTLIGLDDADSSSALAFVMQKLKGGDIKLHFSDTQTSCIERLGGRASDLESLVHKMRSGQAIEEAVEDIINRGVGEIQKNAFGDDAEDAKNLAWTREQAWAVLQKLSKQPEISYSEVLLDFPFKGDEGPLRSMEHAELISIGTHNGRPSTIKPGKPVFRYVFQRLAQDPIFQAQQDLTFNEKVIAGAESNIKTYEDELLKLKEMGVDDGYFASGVLPQRKHYLIGKIRAAQNKIEGLEKKNVWLKKTLATVSVKGSR